MIDNIKKTLKDNCFSEYIEEKYIELEENEGKYYKTRLFVNEKNTYINIDIHKIIEGASRTYLKKQGKDPDYAIMNFADKEVYFIELKQEKNETALKDIEPKFENGKIWIKHICSCSNTGIDNWKYFKIVFRFKVGYRFRKSRQNKNPQFKKNQEKIIEWRVDNEPYLSKIIGIAKDKNYYE